MEDYLEIWQAGDRRSGSGIRKLDKNVVVLVEYEIAALVESSRVAGDVWHFLNAATANLIRSHLYQHDPEVDAVSFGAIDEGDL
ncbi:hypothetical protein GCM10010464_49910 [Pseudonocardia yunnanensis]|uniref:Uncharacterized protein n=1 Tax=Pseudonocardia yunnanensis TaxID=58107 RepID=A0ABW4EQF0_9PSEU